jgi:hypothetical protein
MSNHLSQDQFAKCIVGQSTAAERLHLGECSECTAELDRFAAALTSFRSAVRNRVDDRLALQHAPLIIEVPVESEAAGTPKWRWALVAAAAVFAVLVPFLTSEKKPQEVTEKPSPATTSPDALMDAVNRHLSRTLPAPMEPMMVLIAGDEPVNDPGGVQ